MLHDAAKIAANCQKWSARRNNVNFQHANRAERSCNQKHRLCTLLHSARMEAKRLKVRVHRNVENMLSSSKALEEHVSTVEPSQDLPKNPIRCTPQGTPKQGQSRSVQFCKVRTTRQGRHVEEEILPKASIADRRPWHRRHQRLRAAAPQPTPTTTLVQELELNLRHLHGLRSHGGSHWEWSVWGRHQ